MQYITKIFIMAFLSVTLAGCANGISKQDVGTVAGGVGGGLIGSGLTHGNTAATIGGALGGAYIGNQLAK